MHARDYRRIVVTGIGLCTPFGPDRESSWQQITAGRSAVRWLNSPHWTDDVRADPSSHACIPARRESSGERVRVRGSLTRVAGAPVIFPSKRPFLHSEPLIELALTTASEAVADAGFVPEDLAERSAGVVFGTSKGGLHTFQRLFEPFHLKHDCDSAENPNSTKSAEWLNVWPNQPAAAIGRLIGGYGPVLCPISACATGLAACLRGEELIQNGDCDVVLVGSADSSLQPALIASFRRLGVLSREQTNPAMACRPFDVNRSGFVIGEGAACLVLESFESAKSRHAMPYAEWLGGRMLSDPFGLTQLDPAGITLQRLLRDLRSIGGRVPDSINLHGTATPSNDLIECRAIREVFGDDAPFDCSSLKGGMGHLLGAAGSVELAATALSIRDQIVPPTVNLVVIDPDCRLHLTPNTAKSRRIDHAWKLSLGFGGHVAGACLARFNAFD